MFAYGPRQMDTPAKIYNYEKKNKKKKTRKKEKISNNVHFIRGYSNTFFCPIGKQN